MRCRTWSNKVERLGFDEVSPVLQARADVICSQAESEKVFLDVTDMIDYNIELLNTHSMGTAFFHLDRNDPTVGFSFDASRISGHTYPPAASLRTTPTASNVAGFPNHSSNLLLRLRLGSHLAQYLRNQLEEQKGYSSTVGISTNKLLSKLVGNVNKPKGQTTLTPPYINTNDSASNVTQFIDDHDIGKIPGIGFKTAQKIRSYVLGHPAAFSDGLVYGSTRENVKVKHVRLLEAMGPELLNRLLARRGVPRDLGEKVWGLINGVDLTEVAQAREVPQQISIVCPNLPFVCYASLTSTVGR